MHDNNRKTTVRMDPTSLKGMPRSPCLKDLVELLKTTRRPNPLALDEDGLFFVAEKKQCVILLCFKKVNLKQESTYNRSQLTVNCLFVKFLFVAIGCFKILKQMWHDMTARYVPASKRPGSTGLNHIDLCSVLSFVQ